MKRRGKKFIVAHRRRREGRTDFRKRFSLLKSGKPRLVVRRTTNNTECQIVKHSSKGDHVILSVNSTHLKALGWKSPTGNIPSSYLIGLLCGTRAKEKNIREAVLDTGVISPTKGSRIYACMKGVLDAGIEVPHSPKVLPKEERIRGDHISKHEKKHTSLTKNFEDTKNRILKPSSVTKEKTASKPTTVSKKKKTK